jgi:hypothetical protein
VEGTVKLKLGVKRAGDWQILGEEGAQIVDGDLGGVEAEMQLGTGIE